MITETRETVGEPTTEVEAVGEKEGDGANDIAMLPEIASLMSEVGYDINQATVLSTGAPLLIYAVIKKHLVHGCYSRHLV